MGKRYEVAIINSIKKELAQGVPVKILSKKYNIEGRRIYEWKNETITLESSKTKNVSKTVDIEKTKNITSTSKKQLTIEEVMMNSGVNPNDWTVESASINNWDDSKGDTHYQTKLSLVRKNLDLSVELPSPINITIKGDNSKSPKVHSSIKCALILPDMQVGFRRNLQDGSLEPIHDRDAMNVALQIASFIQADRIVMLGDNLDLAEMSTKYLTTPEFYFTTQASIVELAWWLGKFRSVNLNTKIDYLAGNHECFSEDTEILTEHGWMSYFDVSIDTRLATFNKITNEIEYENYIDKQVYDYNDELYSIKGRSIDLLITPNHRVYWANANSRKPFNMTTISEVKLDESRKVQYCSGVNNRGDYPISDYMIKLIAWIITDGSTDHKNGNIRLYQRKEKLHLITNILDSLGIKYNINCRNRNITSICGVDLKNKPKESCEIYISRKESTAIYELIADKYLLPNWVYLLSERQVDIFINSMVDGDGSRKKECVSCLMLYGTKKVLDQVQHLLVLNGYRASISTYRGNQYRLNITKTNFIHLDRISKYVTKVNYSGKVWDFTVPNDTLVVRRGGKVSITGNCRIDKYMNEKAIHAYGLKPATRTNGSSAISVEGLLGLNDLDIEYHSYPSGKVALNSNLVCIHGEVAKGQSGATVSEVVKSARVSTIQGHIHRHEIATKTTYDAFDNALEVTAASFGCLCSIDPGKVPGMKHLQNWQQGVGVVWYEDNGLEQFRMEFVPIIKGRAIYNQEVFESYESDNIGINIQKETRFKVT